MAESQSQFPGIANWSNGKAKQTLFMSQLKTGMGCTLDGATPDNKAVERGKLDARGRGGIEGWDRGRVRENGRETGRDARRRLRGTENPKKDRGWRRKAVDC